MAKVFEDEFTAIQKDMIEICLEYADYALDMVYIYASYEADTVSCDYFYKIGSDYVERHNMNTVKGHVYDTSIERQKACIGVLMEDVKQLISVCKKYNKEMPTEIKLIYDFKNHKVNADYDYELKYSHKMEKDADDVFEEWFDEQIHM